MPEYDALIIGAGMSGLGAGIRLAHFGKKVCVLERHALWGGLNSFYKKGGRPFDVGLHAMTNFAARGSRGPLSLICRQLRLHQEDFELQEQTESEVRFPSERLRFNNGGVLLESEVARAFPAEIDGYRALVQAVRAFREEGLMDLPLMASDVLPRYLKNSLLITMLLCPLQFYGSAVERDMTWQQFVIMFRAVYLEGFCRPRGGVRGLLATLKREYTQKGGELRLNCGVKRIHSRAGDPEGRVEVELENGEFLVTKKVLSSAGKVETARLLGENLPASEMGRLTFVESIFFLERSVRELGWDKTILFYSHRDDFKYEECAAPVDVTSGIVCAPENFCGDEKFPEGMLRVTNLANFDRWAGLESGFINGYQATKEATVRQQLESLAPLLPPFSDRITYRDTFTPLTIKRFTSHERGAVYGAPRKVANGNTSHPHVHLCGTDQGYLGIVGAILSGVIMANHHVLAGGN